MYYLFSDDEYFHIECESKTIRTVLKEVKDRFRIIGKLKCICHVGSIREYKLIGSDYTFTIREIIK